MDKLELKDEYFLTLAVAQAHCAWQEGNAPIGAVLISQDGQVLAQNHNQAFTNPGLIYHAEMMIFLQNQDFFLKNRRTTTLYTTLEPCVMCLSTALVHHVKRVVWLIDDYWSGGTRCYNHEMTTGPVVHVVTIMIRLISIIISANLSINRFLISKNKSSLGWSTFIRTNGRQNVLP